jgi:hypothetical protein
MDVVGACWCLPSAPYIADGNKIRETIDNLLVANHLTYLSYRIEYLEYNLTNLFVVHFAGKKNE